ncbi:MAG: hypothetical protein AB8U22_03415 [Rickettsia aeschlimannii]
MTRFLSSLRGNCIAIDEAISGIFDEIATQPMAARNDVVVSTQQRLLAMYLYLMSNA